MVIKFTPLGKMLKCANDEILMRLFGSPSFLHKDIFRGSLQVYFPGQSIANMAHQFIGPMDRSDEIRGVYSYVEERSQYETLFPKREYSIRGLKLNKLVNILGGSNHGKQFETKDIFKHIKKMKSAKRILFFSSCNNFDEDLRSKFTKNTKLAKRRVVSNRRLIKKMGAVGLRCAKKLVRHVQKEFPENDPIRQSELNSMLWHSGVEFVNNRVDSFRPSRSLNSSQERLYQSMLDMSGRNLAPSDIAFRGTTQRHKRPLLVKLSKSDEDKRNQSLGWVVSPIEIEI